MDLIPYPFMPHILFHFPYICDLIPYYLSIANGARGGCKHSWTSHILMSYTDIEAIELIIGNWCTIHFNVLLYWNFVWSVTRRVGFIHKVICRKPPITCTNDQKITKVYGSAVSHIQHWLVLFSDHLKPQADSFNR